MRNFLLAIVTILPVSPSMGGGEFTGNIPLAELPPELYLDQFDGGLYPGAVNEIPANHLVTGLTRIAEIVPRDFDGNPSPDGWIVLVHFGGSGTTQSFGLLERMEDENLARNSRVIILNCGFGGLLPGLHNDESDFWDIADSRLAAMNLSPLQVQSAWALTKTPESFSELPFPERAELLQALFHDTIAILHDRYPNLASWYLSPIYYGGYHIPSREPAYYETAFSMKWLIEDQISGDPSINADPFAGPVLAPWVDWGPYLWADGVIPNADGLTYLLEDFENDLVHLSVSGEQKSMALLSAFLNENQTVVPWYLGHSFTQNSLLDVAQDAYVDAAEPDTNFGDRIMVQHKLNTKTTYLKFNVSGVTKPILKAKLSVRLPMIKASKRADLFYLADAQWSELTLTWNNKPEPAPEDFFTQLEAMTREGSLAADVTQFVRQDADGEFTIVAKGLQEGPLEGTFEGGWVSREGGEPSRLVLTLRDPPADFTDDGLVLLDDVEPLLSCLTGPGQSADPFCVEADADLDEDVDMADLAVALTFFGPFEP